MSDSLQQSHSGSTAVDSPDEVALQDLSSNPSPPERPSPPHRRQLPCQINDHAPDPEARNLRRIGISTRSILKDFQKAEPREGLAAEREEWNKQRIQADKALKKLDFAAKASTFWQVMAGCLSRSEKVTEEDSDLSSCWKTAVDFYAPPQSRVLVYIIDFKEDSAIKTVDTVANFEDYLETKPADVKFRWIHVPVGNGLLHSTIEELFNYAGSQKPGRPFSFTGNVGWGFPEMVMLSFWSQKYLANKASAHQKLSEVERKATEKERDILTVSPLDGMSPLQQQDLTWRAGLNDREPDHWLMSESDFPNMLEQPFLWQVTPLDAKIIKGKGIPAQALTQQEKFEGSVLMTSSLRAFHRDDGFILTMSSSGGVHHLGENFRDCMDSSPEMIMTDPDASIFGHTFETFKSTGTSKWGHKTAEWFLIYLFTEAAVVPNHLRHGCITPSYLQGFVALAKDLEDDQLQHDRTKGRHDRSEIVRRYVECIRNMKALHAIILNKQSVLERMTKDCKAFDSQYQDEKIGRNSVDGAEQAEDRLEWAKGLLAEEEEIIDRLLKHFQDSLNIVFQQQSIELNELAVVADSQNSAILIFTTVTIVFLPLSFLTSYFGMNLQGVVDTSHDEPFFWRICGGFATALLGLVFVTAYKKELRRKTRRVLKGQGSRPWAGGRLVGVGLVGEWRRVKDRRRRGGEREGEV